MGAFNDYFQAAKAAVAGYIPKAGTLVPTSETTPIILAHNVKGGHFQVPNTDVLVDIPYEILQLDMEVIVQKHTIAGPTVIQKKKYALTQLPPAGLRVNEVGGYILSNYWTEIALAQDGEDGDDGDNGWTPVIALEDDGPTRVVQKVVGWIGGTGTPPSQDPAQSYIGPTGWAVKSGATNVKGPAGPSPTVAPEYHVRATQGISLSTTQNPTENLKLIQSLNFSNTYTVARKFLIRAKVHVGRISNNQYAYAELRTRESEKPPGAPADNSTWIPDNTYTLRDSHRELVQVPRFSGSDPLGLNWSQANQKLWCEYIIQVPAGNSFSAYLSLRVFASNPLIPDASETIDRSVGDIDVIGL